MGIIIYFNYTQVTPIQVTLNWYSTRLLRVEVKNFLQNNMNIFIIISKNFPEPFFSFKSFEQ